MQANLPLRGIRFHLSGSIWDEAGDQESAGIRAFVLSLTRAVLREGGTLIHGSHPTLLNSLKAAALPYVASGGARDALTLVRSHRFAVTDEHLTEMEAQREYAAVHVIPGSLTENLVSMREWMAERCD